MWAFANSFKTPKDDDRVERLRPLHLAGGYGSGNRVSIHADSSGDPGTNLMTLRYAGRASSVDGTNVYGFRTGWDGLKLAHNTTYWVVVDTPGTTATNYPTKSLTTSDSESSVGLSGVPFSNKRWVIGNTHRNSIEAGVWTDSDYPQAMRMELRGESEPYFPLTKPPSPGKLVGNLENTGGVTLTSPNPGELVINWDAPGNAPDDYRVTWKKSTAKWPSHRSDNTVEGGITGLNLRSEEIGTLTATCARRRPKR